MESERKQAVVAHSYIICNNTQDKLRLKQVETDEVCGIPNRITIFDLGIIHRYRNRNCIGYLLICDKMSNRYRFRRFYIYESSVTVWH